MSYCPECGSEIANQDPFCAYCGISLEIVAEPIVETTAEEAVISEKSPKLGEPEAIKTSASIIDDIISENAQPKVEIINESTLTTPPPPQILADEANLESLIEAENKHIPHQENQIPEAEIVETPLPATDFSDITGDLDFPKKAEVSDVSGELEIETQTDSDNLNEDFRQNTLETVIEDEIIEDAKFFENIEESKNITEENFDATIVDSPSKDEAAMPVAFEFELKNDDERTVTEVEKEDDQEIEIIKNEQESEIIAEPQKIEPIEAEIITEPTNISSEKPLEDVTLIHYPGIKETTSQKLIDEKQISNELNSVNKEIIEEPKEVNEIISEPAKIVEQKNETPVPVTPALVISDDLEEKESRSYTNPNIGVGDTGGKGRKKLKPLDEGTLLINRYEIVRKIGGGGMGAVYLASDKNLGGVLRAVKEMVQSYIADEQQEKAINDFKRESMLLTSLEHPGIPTIYDYFFDEKEGRFYLVMKYISGGDLAARLKAAPEGRIDEVSITDWAIQIADVLDYLHNRQPPIVYRDLKPSNIMIDGNSGKVMIIDFGIARWVNKEEKGVTAVGTMGYAPPELFSGNVEPRSDIYSLGSTMFHLLTGADPQSNPLLIFDFNKNPRPRQINSQLSDQIEQIIMRSVEYNSAQRFASAQEMRNALITHLENLKKGTVTFGVSNNVSTSVSNVQVFCGFCGQKIVASDMFCPFCGAQQPLAGQSQKLSGMPAYIAPQATAKLMILGTNSLESMEYLLEKESNLLGRRDPMSNIFPEIDVSKFDPQTKISRRHARIWRDGDIFMLEDLGSSNGTTLIQTNNEQIRLLPRQPQILTNGDKIKLGDTTLQFSLK